MAKPSPKARIKGPIQIHSVMQKEIDYRKIAQVLLEMAREQQAKDQDGSCHKTDA